MSDVYPVNAFEAAQSLHSGSTSGCKSGRSTAAATAAVAAVALPLPSLLLPPLSSFPLLSPLPPICFLPSLLLFLHLSLFLLFLLSFLFFLLLFSVVSSSFYTFFLYATSLHKILSIFAVFLLAVDAVKLA